MGEVLEVGDEFLDIVQEEIMRAKNVKHTRLLLSSFQEDQNTMSMNWIWEG